LTKEADFFSRRIPPSVFEHSAERIWVMLAKKLPDYCGTNLLMYSLLKKRRKETMLNDDEELEEVQRTSKISPVRFRSFR
jgi:hypothetical protein